MTGDRVLVYSERGLLVKELVCTGTGPGAGGQSHLCSPSLAITPSARTQGMEPGIPTRWPLQQSLLVWVTGWGGREAWLAVLLALLAGRGRENVRRVPSSHHLLQSTEGTQMAKGPMDRKRQLPLCQHACAHFSLPRAEPHACFPAENATGTMHPRCHGVRAGRGGDCPGKEWARAAAPAGLALRCSLHPTAALAPDSPHIFPPCDWSIITRGAGMAESYQCCQCS